MKKIHRTKFNVLIVVLICVFYFKIFEYENKAPFILQELHTTGIFT